MSNYMKFTVEMSSAIGEWKKEQHPNVLLNHNELLLKAEMKVFEKWLVEEKYHELISYINENYDTGGGEYLIEPLSKILESNNSFRLLRRLWLGHLSNMSGYKSTNEILSKLVQIKNIFKVVGLNHDAQIIQEEIEMLEQGATRKKIATIDKRKMTAAVFWELIEEARSKSNFKADISENLILRLTQFKAKEIKNFQILLTDFIEKLNTWDCWALAYVARSGCGDDEFDYFKAWVVSLGKESFSLARDNLKLFSKQICDLDEDSQFEELLYAAEYAYEKKLGKLLPDLKLAHKKIKGKPWKEENLVIRYPEICKDHGYKVSKT